MRKLIYWVALVSGLHASAQYYPVSNANDNYVVTILPGKDHVIKSLHKIKKDNRGLYWLESLNELNSFDGITWKTHRFKSATGKNIIVRINDMEITDDGTVWLATEGGMYVFEPGSGNLVPIRQKFPGITEAPFVANCTFKYSNNLLFICIIREGFYYFDSKSKELKHIIIDSTDKTYVPTTISPVAPDKSGNFWGITADNKGIWQYNTATGKISRSWKGEIFPSAAKRFQSGITGVTYGKKENVLWICYGNRGVLEKLYLPGGESKFYSFTGDLQVRNDSAAKNRHSLNPVKVDRDNNEWINIEGKYLVKLHPEIDKFEYLAEDPDLLPLGKGFRYLPEIPVNSSSVNENNNSILLWVMSEKQLAVVKRRNAVVRQIPFDTVSVPGLKAADMENTDGRKNIFFEKGRGDNYFLLQQDPGRPKLICLDGGLKVRKVLLDDEWKKYPAYFSTEFNPDTFYVAVMRPGIEPLDFRNVILRDFRIDLRTFRTEEVNLSFRQRVQRYGLTDATGVSWLFSGGRLYSFEPVRDLLDSIYICPPLAKGPFNLEYVKGYDYPVVLHRESSTYWIAFFPTKELYKINLKTRKIEKIFKSCFDKKDCEIPAGVSDMYVFDRSRIYLQAAFSGLLLNAFNDSLTFNNDLFENRLSNQGENGAGLYKDWICVVQPASVHFLNIRTGQRKILSIYEDFKGRLSQFNSRPLVNAGGEMFLMSSAKKEFIVFDIDFPDPEKPGNVHFSEIKLNNRSLLPDSLGSLPALTIKYKKYSSLYFRFSDYSIDDQYKINYEYALYTGGDTTWNRIEGDPELNLIKISPGKYQLLVRAENEYGAYSTDITVCRISIIPPFTQTAWFILVLIAAVVLLLYGLYRYRLQQLARLQKIRNNIASDLHDDIGSTLNSISIYSEVAKQQAGKPIPALDLIGENSRKIVESMSDIVWTINPANDSFEKIIVRMRSFAHQLLKAKKVEYTFEVDEQLNRVTLPMQVRKNFYLVFKEAVTNVVKYSGASRVAISLVQEDKAIVFRIKDNGIGIPVNAETQGNGLMNMKRRAEEINALLLVRSSQQEGTGIEMTLKTS